MIPRLLLALALVSSVFAADNPNRSVTIRDWSITIPADTEEHKNDGPDFSVTYFIFPKLKAQFGIYEGGHPQEFASKQKNVTTKKEKIAGQTVTWSIWKEQADGKEFLRAELFLVCATTQFEPGTTYEEKFHIFLAAPDDQSLITLQEVIRTLSKNEPGKAPVPEN